MEPSIPRPQLRIRPATPADADAIVNIKFGAFANEVMERLMYPDGGSQNARARFARELFPPPGEAADPSAELLVMVAELPPQQEGQEPAIVAFAKWKLVRDPLPKDKWDVFHQSTEEELGEGADAAVYNKFFGGMHDMRMKWVKGDPCLYLALLACDPNRQRLGAGSALLRAGLELADREGLNAWLEATPAGFHLYTRYGFEAVDVQDLEVTELWGAVQKEHEDWGATLAVPLAGELPKGRYRTALMRRIPRKA